MNIVVMFLRVTALVSCFEGEKVKEFCTERMKTVCVPCVEGKFSDKYSIFDRCNECRSCHGKDKKGNPVLVISVDTPALAMHLTHQIKDS